MEKNIYASLEYYIKTLPASKSKFYTLNLYNNNGLNLYSPFFRRSKCFSLNPVLIHTTFRAFTSEEACCVLCVLRPPQSGGNFGRGSY